MRPSFVVAAALGIGCLVTSAGVSAQTRYENYDYRFQDDDLVGDTLTTPPPLLTLRQKGRRVMLLRPRVSFAAELIGTVETM
jgi:hypothetical protein